MGAEKHGVPVDPVVFHRHILRSIKKAQYEQEIEVNWKTVNPHWSARLNHEEFRRLKRLLPFDMLRSDDFDFCDAVIFLYDTLNGHAHKSRDKKVLKHLKIVANEDEAA